MVVRSVPAQRRSGASEVTVEERLFGDQRAGEVDRRAGDRRLVCQLGDLGEAVLPLGGLVLAKRG